MITASCADFGMPFPPSHVFDTHPQSAAYPLPMSAPYTAPFPAYTGPFQTWGQPTPSASTITSDGEAGFIMRLLCDTFGVERERLGIPKDPQLWSHQNVRDWLSWALREFSLDGISLNKFAAFDGPAICQLTQQQLVALSPPYVGDILYRHLQDLKRAASIDDCLSFGALLATDDIAKAADFVSDFDLPDVDAMNVDVSPAAASHWQVPDGRVAQAQPALNPAPLPPAAAAAAGAAAEPRVECLQRLSHGTRTPSVSSLSSGSSAQSTCSASPFASPVHSPCPSPPHPTTTGSSPQPSSPSLGSQETMDTDSQSSPLAPVHGACNGGSSGQVQLWQFLLELLTDRDAQSCISWTQKKWEFKLCNPEAVARRWGERKNKPRMNYEKLSRGLRYYYDKNIIHKVQGKRYVYKFVCDIESLLGLSWAHLQQFLAEPDSQPISFSTSASPTATTAQGGCGILSKFLASGQESF